MFEDSVKMLSMCFAAQSLGGGALTKILYGEAPPRGPTRYPFVYHF